MSGGQQPGEICFALNCFFGLAVYVRLDFTPGEENNKSISLFSGLLTFQNVAISKYFTGLGVKVAAT